MANPILNDAAAFRPHGGGYGVRFSCTTSAASSPVGIPGSEAASDASNIVKVRVVVSGDYSACVRLNGTANAQCMEIFPGTPEIFTVPYTQGGVTISGLAISGPTVVQATAGDGY